MFSDPKSHLPDKAVENYTWVAEEIPNLPTGQTQTWLLRLLIYYLRGMNHSLITASYRENYPDLAQSRDELEVQLEKLEIAIRSVDPARHHNFHPLRDMVIVDPSRRASAGEMLDKLFNGEGRSTPRNEI